MNKPQMTLAPQTEVKAHEQVVAQFLKLLGHPEALVTDESTFLDFLPLFDFPTLESANAELRRLLLSEPRLVRYAPVFDSSWTLVKAAQLIAKDRP